MKIRLDGRTALVGGSSAGLGLAIAKGMAAAGANLVLCARTAANLERAAKELEAAGTEVLAVSTDLTRVEEIERLASAALERFGTVDILVNNAGGPAPGLFDQLGEESWRQ
ncbi:MAG: SDR family NAD(P)-dependent oxidoreductase, partial [Acidobacteriota bacterium]